MVRLKSEFNLYECPCCGYAVLKYINGCEVCEICFWEDDGSNDDTLPEEELNPISLNQARLNFIQFGASEKKWSKVARKPQPDEIRIREFHIVNDKAVAKL